MMLKENNLDVRSIKDLLGKKFWIPSYQRGYRWKADIHVEDLLDDLLEFQEKQKQESEFYCLQPIVVTKKGEEAEQPNKWEVIDGQQRLTTIFLILKYLENEKIYQIEYDTRKGSKDFLGNVKDKSKEESLENVDFYHIYKAYEKIENWFKAKDSDFKENFKNTLLKNCKIIWYEVNEKNTIDIFTRLNMGKIPLTNAELIKALFLNSSNFKGDEDDEKQIKLKQLEIATEWDRIEYALQKDDLWCFVSNGEYMPTRIDFIFKLITGKNNQEDKYEIFRHFLEKFKEEQDKKTWINEQWGEIKITFQTIEEWFDDRELYHKVGFLIAIPTGTGLKKIFDDSRGKTKTAFRQYLDGRIAERVNFDLDDLEYNNNKSQIRSVLLLHNIRTMLNNKNETSRFPFDRYKNENWDIEHIHANATRVNVGKGKFQEWLKDNFVESTKRNDEELYQKIQNIIRNGEEVIEDEMKSNIIEYVLGEDNDYISNLCLLDSSTNRSYKNAGFKSKRSEIIKREKAGTFIPICTRNVFMKYYSEKATSLDLWNESDRNSYFENIKTILNPK